jgi:RNA polymerase subunit RPABC4/transcription elongation factor Spt4
MELTCSRCQQTVTSDDCFCPYCGLPQLVYTADGSAAQGQPEPSAGAPRDASQVDWKPALRSVLAFAVPAGLFCAIPVGVGILGLLLMAAIAAWVVALYMRSRRPAWITIGAGARIGLVTGILAGAVCFTVSSAFLFVQRYAFHQGSRIDSEWKALVDMDMQFSQQIASAIGSSDSAQTLAMQVQQKAWMLSPEGHAGMVVANLTVASLLFILCAVTGGALCARMMGRSRRPQS